MIIEYREIKPSKIPPIYSATPTQTRITYTLHLITITKPIDRNNEYSESWKK